jgi:hypothetical protein
MATFDTSNIDNITKLGGPSSVFAGEWFDMSFVTTTADIRPRLSLHLTHRDGKNIDAGMAVLNLTSPQLVGTTSDVGRARYFQVKGCRFPPEAAGFRWTITCHLWLSSPNRGDGESCAFVEVPITVQDPRPFEEETKEARAKKSKAPEQPRSENSSDPIVPPPSDELPDIFGTTANPIVVDELSPEESAEVARALSAVFGDPESPEGRELPPPDEILWGDESYYRGE